MGWSTIRCKHCNVELDGCRGRHGWWMHQGTRSEFCSDGVTLAQPLTPQDVEDERVANARPCAECGMAMPGRSDGRGGMRRYCSMSCSQLAAARRAAARYEAKRRSA